LNVTSQIELDSDFLAEILVQAMQTGHGYNWKYLVRSPRPIAHGQSTKGSLPDLTIIGRRVLIWGGDTEIHRRLKRVVDTLSKQTGGLGAD
jgi:hypothetical protein